MNLNATKSNHMIIRKSAKYITSHYSINNGVVPTVNEVKCLCVYLTNDLKWNKHTNVITSKSF
jgi:hypothetical protein